MSEPHKTSLLSSIKPIPLILASSENLEHWPVSRIKLPIQFQRSRQNRSTFENSVIGATSIDCSTAPLICVQSTCLETAIQQLALSGVHCNASSSTRLMVEPADRGSLNSIINAAISVLAIENDPHLLIIDATHQYDWVALKRTINQHTQLPGLPRALVAFGEPAAKNTRNCKTVVRKTVPMQHKNLAHFNSNIKCPVEHLYSVGLITLINVKKFLSHVKKWHPSAGINITKAIDFGSQTKNQYWPDLNIWSALEYQTFDSFLIRQSNISALRPTQVTIKEDSSENSNTVYHNNCTNCTIESDGHLIVAAGCSDLKIISTRDATLVVKSGDENRITPLLDNLRKIEKRELFEPIARQHPWGTECSYRSVNTFELGCLEIYPSQTLRTSSQKSHSVLWVVLGGSGKVRFNEVEYELSIGVTLQIPAGIRVSCSNTSNENLLIQQTSLQGEIKFMPPTTHDTSGITPLELMPHHRHNTAKRHVLQSRRTTSGQRSHL